MSKTRFSCRAGAAVSGFLLAACDPGTSTSPQTSGETSGNESASAPEGGSALPRIELPVGKGETVEGLLDVDGHDIYARCSGTGSPTVVYFSGWAPDASKLGVNVIKAIEGGDDGRHRICSYERRNTGRSETVEGPSRQRTSSLMWMAYSKPWARPVPSCCSGRPSVGWFPAPTPWLTLTELRESSCSTHHVPDDYVIDERHGFDGMCLKANREADAWDSLEKIDNCRLAKWAYDRRDREPDVPLIYLAAKDSSDRGDVADDPLRKAYVHRWSPGIWKSVSAPHWMDEATPSLVVKNLKQVIALRELNSSRAVHQRHARSY